MLLGLVLSAAATTATTSADPQSFGHLLGSLPLLLPLLPIAVLAIPFVDLLLAIVRRVRRGQSPFAPDKEHLHHRLLEIGHTHRRAVLLLYFWSALLAFGGVALSLMRGPRDVTPRGGQPGRHPSQYPSRRAVQPASVGPDLPETRQ